MLTAMADVLPLWLLVAATLGWCGVSMKLSFSMARRCPAKAGKLRLAVATTFVLPPFVLLSALLPWANARVALNFTYCWVTPCKLLLLTSANFMLDCSSWALSRNSHFLAALLLPVIIKCPAKTGTVAVCLPRSSVHSLFFDLCALICFLSSYDSLTPPVSHAAHCLVLYVVLDLPHRIASLLLLLLCGVETLPTFCEPWLATSLTNFWGKRWDLTAHALLRHSVYLPIINLLTRESATMPKIEAAPTSTCHAAAQPSHGMQSQQRSLHAMAASSPLPLSVRLIGVNITFAVSGLIHELLYFTLTQADAPTWQVTAFFVVHGLATSAEIIMRRACPKHAIFKMPRFFKIFLTLGFMYVTSAWLFFPQLTRANIFRKSTQEYRAIKELMGMGIKTLYSSTLITAGSHSLLQ